MILYFLFNFKILKSLEYSRICLIYCLVHILNVFVYSLKQRIIMLIYINHFFFIRQFIAFLIVIIHFWGIYMLTVLRFIFIRMFNRLHLFIAVCNLKKLQIIYLILFIILLVVYLKTISSIDILKYLL